MNTTQDSPRLVTTDDVATLLHYHVEYFRNRYRNGTLDEFPAAIRIGRRMLWFEQEVLAWLNAHRARPVTPVQDEEDEA